MEKGNYAMQTDKYRIQIFEGTEWVTVIRLGFTISEDTAILVAEDIYHKDEIENDIRVVEIVEDEHEIYTFPALLKDCLYLVKGGGLVGDDARLWKGVWALDESKEMAIEKAEIEFSDGDDSKSMDKYIVYETNDKNVWVDDYADIHSANGKYVKELDRVTNKKGEE